MEQPSEQEAIASYLHPYRGLYAGFAVSPDQRRRVAAGGLVTTLMATALRDKLVDGVVMSRSDFTENRIGYRIDIVTDPDEVQAYGKSVYFNIPIEREWKRFDIFDGRLAICALPCHTRILRKMQEGQKRLRNVGLFVSLFCGHNNEIALWDFVLRKKGIDQSRIVDMRTNRLHMRGFIDLEMNDGSIEKVYFREFNTYRRLWMFAKDLCRYCDEHLGAEADISVGDIFVKPFVDREIRHSAVVTRTDAGEALVNGALNRGLIALEPIDAEILYTAQKSILVPSRDALSRYYANRLYGHKSKKPESGVFRVRSFLMYVLLLGNNQLSQTKAGRFIFKLFPVKLLYLYLKALNVIKGGLRPKA